MDSEKKVFYDLKNSIGRPRKSDCIGREHYFRIVNKPESPTSLIEFKFTDPFDMRKYMQTLKSNKVTELWVICKPDKVIFCGMMESQLVDEGCVENGNNSMFLHFNCNEIYRYYYKQDVYAIITNKEKINHLLGEIGESSREISMVIDANISDHINFSIRNSKLLTVTKFNIRCERKTAKDFNITLPRNNIKYCVMNDVDVNEYKKMLSSKFKKKVSDCKIIFYNGTVKISFRKDVTDEMEVENDENYSLYKIDNTAAQNEQTIMLMPNVMHEMKYPKKNIVSFLLHIKGKFSIEFGDKCIVLTHRGRGVTMISHIQRRD